MGGGAGGGAPPPQSWHHSPQAHGRGRGGGQGGGGGDRGQGGAGGAANPWDPNSLGESFFVNLFRQKTVIPADNLNEALGLNGTPQGQGAPAWAPQGEHYQLCISKLHYQLQL